MPPESSQNRRPAFDGTRLFLIAARAAFDEERVERLRQMPHRSPRGFGKAMSLWTLDLAAETSFEHGITQ